VIGPRYLWSRESMVTRRPSVSATRPSPRTLTLALRPSSALVPAHVDPDPKRGQRTESRLERLEAERMAGASRREEPDQDEEACS
jgi:hypothetical protein